MQNIVILDCETTGLDPEKGKLIEIAAILFHIPTRSIQSIASTLLYSETNDAFEINRIDPESLKKIPATIELLQQDAIVEMMIIADAIVAHNAEFDKKWIETIPKFQQISREKKWICTRNDVIWPVRKGLPLNLIHICVDLGVPVVSAHRSHADCLLLLEAINSIDDIEFFLDSSGANRKRYEAIISYDQRQLAKDNGFQWDNLKKVWFAKITEDQANCLPFSVYVAE